MRTALFLLSLPLMAQNLTVDGGSIDARRSQAQGSHVSREGMPVQDSLRYAESGAEGRTSNGRQLQAVSMPSLRDVPRRPQQFAFHASQAFALAGAFADVRSSYGLTETNPLLGRGDFGHRQAAISLAITSGLLILEGPIVRNHPSMKKPLTILNYFVGSLRFATAMRNSSLK